MAVKPEQYFQQKLMHWHQHSNNRQLPWKGERDVYKIWLSEIILQQTRANQGLKYYERFLNAYPTIQHLAKAPLEEVYKLWEGLGYYNRCRNLHATARQIVFDQKGIFPNSYQSILQLKGVGPYTAAAIASFAFDLPHAVVDGNVFRVLSRFFSVKLPIDSTKGKKYFTQLAGRCLDKEQPARYNQAIMDFGATVCKPDLPLCTQCVLKRKCRAFVENKVAKLPVKEKEIKQRVRWFEYYIIEHKGLYAVEKRTSKDIWFHLYQFPVKEFKSKKDWDKITEVNHQPEQGLLKGKYKVMAYSGKFSQKLSHQTINARAVFIQVSGARQLTAAPVEWKTKEQIAQLPFPRIIHELLKEKTFELFKQVT